MNVVVLKQVEKFIENQETLIREDEIAYMLYWRYEKHRQNIQD